MLFCINSTTPSTICCCTLAKTTSEIIPVTAFIANWPAALAMTLPNAPSVEGEPSLAAVLPPDATMPMPTVAIEMAMLIAFCIAQSFQLNVPVSPAIVAYTMSLIPSAISAAPI